MLRTIKTDSQDEIRDFFGLRDENARLLEDEFDVKVSARPDGLKVSGKNKGRLEKAAYIIEHFLQLIRTDRHPDKRQMEMLIRNVQNSGKKDKGCPELRPAYMDFARPGRKEKVACPRTKGQVEYVEAIKRFDIVFGLGPAGTGKTYLAMAMAVAALNAGQVRRIVLTRPALEAGENLGFLPGDVNEKLAPYLRPLYDALYDMMEAERIEKFMETGIIEVAPLAYMRGRTLNDAFIVLDEAQNCTPEQLKMFLTRLGFDSKAVITGDMTQSDRPGGKPLGLIQATELLSHIDGIRMIYLTGDDVVRHELVQRIIEAYGKAKLNHS